MNVEILSGDNKLLADIALKARLYVSGWTLSGDLKYIRNGRVTGEVFIAVVNGSPIGVAVGHTYGDCVFVRKSMRNKGIGTLLAKAVKAKCGKFHIGVEDKNKVIEKSRKRLMEKLNEH